VTKTFHAQVSIITGCFAEDFAGCYSASGKTEALQLEQNKNTG